MLRIVDMPAPAGTAPEVELTRLQNDWHGRPLDFAAEFGLRLDPGYLWLSWRIERAPDADLTLPRGSFVEALWERDVVELFLFERSQSGYQEFNFSPAGAWWSCEFTSYRVRAQSRERSAADPAPVLDIVAGNHGWRGIAGVPREMLSVEPPGEDGSLWNITALLGRERRALSLRRSKVLGEPDFHLRD